MKKAVSVFMVRTGDVESGKWMVDGRWPTVLASVVIASRKKNCQAKLEMPLQAVLPQFLRSIEMIDELPYLPFVVFYAPLSLSRAH